MKLIIGLGNPEDRYTSTRHNLGWRVLDTYAQKHEALFQAKSKMKGLIAEIQSPGEKIILLKPTTYYNSSGEAARAVADFYKIPLDNILIVHDELALPFGTIRTRIGGSDAGNNGVKSITEYLGIETARLRIGVWNELRDKIPDADFVLSRLSEDEEVACKDSIEIATSLIDSFVSDQFKPSTHS